MSFQSEITGDFPAHPGEGQGNSADSKGATIDLGFGGEATQ
jgi:hypothetical protein